MREQVNTNECDVLQTTDARVWAKAFLSALDSGVEQDEELMVVWFANAIETGRSAGERTAAA